MGCGGTKQVEPAAPEPEPGSVAFDGAVLLTDARLEEIRAAAEKAEAEGGAVAPAPAPAPPPPGSTAEPERAAVQYNVLSG